jgi:hypothetical protein
MFEIADLVRPALWVLRVLWWLAWDLLLRTIGWSIGWAIWRAVTFGRYPDADISELDDMAFWPGLMIELTGLIALAVGLFWLSHSLSMA